MIKKLLKKIGHGFIEYNGIILCSWWTALALVEFNHLSFFFLVIAFMEFRAYQQQNELRRQSRLINTLFETNLGHLECITDLANRLIPFMGQEAVTEILKKHQIEWEKAWKDYNDKYPPNAKKQKHKDKAKIGLEVLKPVVVPS